MNRNDLTGTERMGHETVRWYNDNVLMGYVGDREHWAANHLASWRDGEVRPWFENPGYTGKYDGPVPVEAVQERLLNWKAVTSDQVSFVDQDGIRREVPGRQVIYADDNGQPLGIFKSGYKIHQYDEWLMDNVAAITGEDVQIDCAGLVKARSICWVSVSLPETLVSEAGFGLRSKMLNYTSHSGRFATTYAVTTESPLCDNSIAFATALAKKDSGLKKIKHSARSLGRVDSVRVALGMLEEQAEQMLGTVDQLAETPVSRQEFRQIIDVLEPVPVEVVGPDGKVQNQRAITMADARRQEIAVMYALDPRASAWEGTALGVLQAVNTWEQHHRGAAEGVDRFERRMMAQMTGDVRKQDDAIIAAIQQVFEANDRELVLA